MHALHFYTNKALQVTIHMASQKGLAATTVPISLFYLLLFCHFTATFYIYKRYWTGCMQALSESFMVTESGNVSFVCLYHHMRRTRGRTFRAKLTPSVHPAHKPGTRRRLCRRLVVTLPHHREHPTMDLDMFLPVAPSVLPL